MVALLLVVAIGLGIWFFAGNSGEPVNVYAFSNIGMTEYWGDSRESYGFVQTDKVQTVFLSTTQNVTEVLVSQGDTVKKGDVLMTFDTTLSDLALERKRLDVEKLKLQLEDAKARLWQIVNMKPMIIPEPSDEEESDENLGIALTDPYKISSKTEYDGSSTETSMICWLKDDTILDNFILEEIRLRAEEFQNHNATLPPEVTDSEETEPATEPTEPEPIVVNKFYVTFKVTNKNRSLATKTAWQGMIVSCDTANGGFRFQFFDASTLPDHMLAPDEEADKEPEIDYGSGFTAAQIAEMRAQQEKTIRDLEFNIKMAETEYKIMLTEVNDGKVYAQVDGTVVSLLTPEDAQMTQQPMIKVSGGGGFYVEGSISELERDSVAIGSEVTVNDWNTGMAYVGTVEQIGDYPSSNNYWSGMGNPTATYYPFTVFVADDADLQSGSYVNMVYSSGATQNGIYLENPFLRTEAGRSYVFVMDADGKLEKRYVTTGKSLWGNYTEILDGITAEDFLAFPYGKNVKDGAPAVEAEIRELYE